MPRALYFTRVNACREQAKDENCERGAPRWSKPTPGRIDGAPPAGSWPLEGGRGGRREGWRGKGRREGGQEGEGTEEEGRKEEEEEADGIGQEKRVPTTGGGGKKDVRPFSAVIIRF